MKSIGIILLGLLLLAGCSSGNKSTTNTVDSPNTTPIKGLGSYAFSEPVNHGNMTLIPLVRTAGYSKQDSEYTTLSEAKKAGTVEITELKGREEVNRLLVNNLGSKPLMLLGGELLLGGKQDRIVAKDVIIPAHDEAIVNVFCVEHGRWTDDGDKSFSSVETNVPQSVREKATFGNQQEVWDSVEGYNSAAKAPTNTTSLRAGLLKADVQSRIGEGLKELDQGLSANDQIVGFVCLIDGKIVTMEIFANNKLFRAHQESLLKGLLSETEIDGSRAPSRPNLDEVAEFVSAALSGERRQTGLYPASSRFEVSGQKTRGVEMQKPSEGEATASTIDNEIIHGTYSPQTGSGQ